MLWMIRWAGSFPVFVKEAKGAHFTDVDGNSYLDLCLGDTGAMTGHAPEATVKAINEQIQKGITLMLPVRGCHLGRRGTPAPLRSARTGSSPSPPPTPTASSCAWRA
ncbi:MAG: aminotransferase class III-fold pyridoxal phosphate-dependent enzyme [Desulfobacterales bacterium]|nr:aminotransferase class III-fold pyridoxal phosphate-dependent enzyme [Desulfobacterales bacterium]